MNFTFSQTENTGQWNNGDGKGQPMKCGYNHHKQEVFVHVIDAYMRDAHYDAKCSYDEVIKRYGNYKWFEKYMLKYGTQEVLDQLIQIVEDSQMIEGGSDPSYDNEDDGSIHHADLSNSTNTTSQSSSTRPQNKPLKLNYDKKKDWTKTGDSLQSFTWQSLKAANFKKVPTYVYVVLSPFLGLMFLLGPLTIYDAINRGNYFMVFIGLLSIGIGLLLLFGIADYWTRKTKRHTQNDYRLVNGKSLLMALRGALNNKAYIADPPTYSMQKEYTTLLKASAVSREHLYLGSSYMVGYCELFYTSGSGKHRHTSERSCFAIKFNHDQGKARLYDKKIGKWFKDNHGIDLSNFLNTNGFTMVVEGNHAVFLFRDLLYKSEYIFEIFCSLVAAMEATAKNAR